MASVPAAPRTPHGRARLIALGRATKPIREASGVARAMFWSGVGITVFFILLALLAPVISPYNFNQYESGGHRFAQLAHPSSAHVFGTTVQSVDVLSRVIYGTQTELEVVAIALAMSLAIGVPLGLVSGYFGGILDRFLVLIMDAIFAFPYLLIAIVIAFVLATSSIGGGVLTAAFAITAAYVPLYFRVVRNHVISVREEPYVDAARALGARPRTVIRKYVFFNVVQTVPPIATLNAADAILLLAALGFLGYGIQPSQGAEWGCGKSTLGRGILGLLPDGARAYGEVLYERRNLVAMPPKAVRRMRGPELGLIFQEPMTRLNPLLRISDHFRETLEQHEPDLTDAEVKRRSLETLGRMGIPPTRFR